MHQSFLLYRRSLFLKLAVLLTVLSVTAYIIYAPATGLPHNGGTWLGYTLGGIGTALILWLMWLGIRKRSYTSRFGSVQGWVSAHVYLGISLVFIVTLHTGFQFGFNIHTLSYVLMLLVVVSGAYGVFAYLWYPQKMMENLAGSSQNLLLHEIFNLEQECLKLGDTLGEDLHAALLHSMETPIISNNTWQQLTRSKPWTRLPLSRQRRRELKQAGLLDDGDDYDFTMYLVADKLLHTDDSEQTARMSQLLEVLSRKNALVERLRRNVQYQALLDFWRYLHIPLSFALLASLIIHIITVFLYW